MKTDIEFVKSARYRVENISVLAGVQDRNSTTEFEKNTAESWRLFSQLVLDACDRIEQLQKANGKICEAHLEDESNTCPYCAAVEEYKKVERQQAANEFLKKIVQIDVQVLDEIKDQYFQCKDLMAKMDWRKEQVAKAEELLK